MEIAKVARKRIKQAARLVENYTARGAERQAAALRSYISAMDRVRDAAEDAEEAWTRYLRSFRRKEEQTTGHEGGPRG